MKKKFLIIFTIFCVFANVLNAKDSEKSRLEALAKLTKTMAIVENNYVDELSFSQIVDKAISGLMSNLDAHSSFMDEQAFNDTKIQTEGEFGGLGITVGMKDGALTVIAPIEGTPADKAGLKANDVILRIDNNATFGISIDEAVKKMRGKPKTSINLTIVRKGEMKPFDVKIVRDMIKVESVYAKMIEKDDILYLRVTNFDQHVTNDAKKFIQENAKAKGIILDLRNNPGGLLEQAIGLANLFIGKGTIVSQKGRNKNENISYEADPKKKITNLPLAVLINSGSASASEIVSGALQDTKRGIIIGENSFGKGSVQVILPIEDKEALRLTIAKYYLPSGRTIQAVGVAPDLVVFPGKVPADQNEFSIKEADLKKHLEGELAKIEPVKSDSKNDDKIITQKQVNDDIQLKTAIDTIKVLNIH
ncbi:S41 family peptidase [Campylobacter hominis]|uniref:Carboxy--processing protease (C-terminal-processing protease) n=1 Tax=Campylobacter hominis (strain ATCC BAA-381 / DSM 21671 / CCUG 45161 / LMG 19568 / NCTC 13146 / CH001A) TaxID=360107 RepID=A7I1M1_CAMHC|nr:carboxy--processing protease (C-terminal-processing protease) [Campylobacter hominis ATCC BAA-381]SUW84952.1 carboxy--processing protease (C-terminal-processing protease) [Campylobacter hominis]